MKRSTKTKLLQLVLLGLIGVLVVLLWRPAEVHYYLFQLRRDQGPASAAINPVCELGEDARGPLIDAVHAYAHDPGFFRTAAFQALACLRQVTITEDPALFPAPDEEAIDAMARLYEEEPSVARRRSMEQVSSILDEWSRLLFWESIAEDERPEPPLQFVSHCPQQMGPCGNGALLNVSPRYEVEWCSRVGPVLVRWLSEGVSGVSDFAIIQRLSEHDCLGDGTAAVEALQARHVEVSDGELNALLTFAYADSSSQSAILAELIRSNPDCDGQRSLHRGLEVRRPHTAATQDVLEAWVTNIDTSCLREIFADVPADERRRQMSSSLGLSAE